MTPGHTSKSTGHRVWSVATESRHLRHDVVLGTEIDQFDERMRFAKLCEQNRLKVVAALGVKYVTILVFPLLAIALAAEVVATIAGLK